MFSETSPEYRAVFFPGSAREPPEPAVAKVEMPVPAFEMMMAMAKAAYSAGYRLTPAGVLAPTTIEGSA